MRSGTVKAGSAALCALAAALAIAPAAHAGAGTSTSLTTVKGPGAHASASLDVFTLAGAPEPNRISTHLDPSGRLVLMSPEGIVAPSSPGGECRQEGASQVSCAAGFVDAIAGDLGAGADSFTAEAGLPVAIGLNMPGPSDRPLAGAGGNDRLIGGGGDDLILGGRGADRLGGDQGTDILRGEGGADILAGGAGRDKLNGGAGRDKLNGGAGRDKLNGGAGRDRCRGGGGRDKVASCAEIIERR
ncbi:MAG: calcium-binding protein [Solirubrobacterales bacterium]